MSIDAVIKAVDIRLKNVAPAKPRALREILTIVLRVFAINCSSLFLPPWGGSR